MVERYSVEIGSERKDQSMKIKRIISFVLAAAMSLSLISAQSITASAASSNSKKVSAARIWSGKADKSWYTGDKDSYDISTAEELAGFAELVDEAAHDDRFRGITINLTSDIVLNDTANWQNWENKPPKNEWNPIGKVGNSVSGYNPFAGVFNGNGHTISGIYVNTVEGEWIYAKASPAGLFEYISGAVICNLKIDKSVIVGSPAGALTGLSENSYTDSVEVSNSIVQGACQGLAGGLIGKAGRVNMTLMMFNIALLGAGVLINPIIFSGSDGSDMVRASYVNNCKANNVTLHTNAWAPNAGGIVGQIFRGGIYNSISVNTTFSSTENYRRDWAHYGAILGGEEFQGECELKNCYTYNYKVKDSDKEKSKKLKRSDKDRVKLVSKETLSSSELAEKLGSGFKRVKGGSPRITSISVPKVNIRFNGDKATFSWNKVKGAVKYVIYYKKDDGKYHPTSSGTKTEVVLSPINKGGTYSMMIRSFDSEGNYTDISGGAFTFTA